jgi:hypothetical protein
MELSWMWDQRSAGGMKYIKELTPTKMTNGHGRGQNQNL